MRRTAVVDVGASVLAIAFLVVAPAHIAVGRDEHPLDALAYGLLVVAGGTLSLARRWPWITLGVVTVVLTTYIVREYAGRRRAARPPRLP